MGAFETDSNSFRVLVGSGCSRVCNIDDYIDCRKASNDTSRELVENIVHVGRQTNKHKTQHNITRTAPFHFLYRTQYLQVCSDPSFPYLIVPGGYGRGRIADQHHGRGVVGSGLGRGILMDLGAWTIARPMRFARHNLFVVFAALVPQVAIDRGLSGQTGDDIPKEFGARSWKTGNPYGFCLDFGKCNIGCNAGAIEVGILGGKAVSVSFQFDTGVWIVGGDRVAAVQVLIEKILENNHKTCAIAIDLVFPGHVDHPTCSRRCVVGS